MPATTIEVGESGLFGFYRIPRTGGAIMPVEVLKARRTGHLRVDLLVTPVGGLGEFWVRQSSLVSVEADVEDTEYPVRARAE